MTRNPLVISQPVYQITLVILCPYGNYLCNVSNLDGWLSFYVCGCAPLKYIYQL